MWNQFLFVRAVVRGLVVLVVLLIVLLGAALLTR